jgi:hypothetical protein
MNLLAQANIDSAPATTFKWVIVILVGLAIAAAFVWSAVRPAGKQSVKVDREDQPVEFRKAPKRYNHDLAEERYVELTRRLNKHDEEIEGIQKSRNKALNSINRRFERLLLGVAIIATKVGARMPDEQSSEGDEEV